MPQNIVVNTTDIRITGIVQDGEKVGRTIGFPTANLSPVPASDDLKLGVYAASCTVLEKRFDCMAYFGPRLIFNEVQNVFEIFIIDFSAKIYGEKIEVIVQEYIRGPKKLGSLEELKEQLASDLQSVKEIINARAS